MTKISVSSFPDGPANESPATAEVTVISCWSRKISHAVGQLSPCTTTLSQPFSRVRLLSLLQGILPIQGSNPGLPHCRQIVYQLSHKGSPRILEVGSLSLLQWIFLTRKLNWGLLQCRWILYLLSHKGNPRILEWVIYPFSRGAS